MEKGKLGGSHGLILKLGASDDISNQYNTMGKFIQYCYGFIVSVRNTISW